MENLEPQRFKCGLFWNHCNKWLQICESPDPYPDMTSRMLQLHQICDHSRLSGEIQNYSISPENRIP